MDWIKVAGMAFAISLAMPECVAAARVAAPESNWDGPTGKASVTPELAIAFRSAYGKKAPAQFYRPMLAGVRLSPRDGRASLITEIKLVTYLPVKLLRVGRWTVLISEVSFPGAHIEEGAMAVTYLAGTPEHYRRERDWTLRVGNGFGGPPQWRVRRDLSRWPMLVTEFGYGGAECSTSSQALYELTPSGPVRRAVLEGSPELTPRIRGRSFWATNEFRRQPYRYDRLGETYKPVNGKPRGVTC